LSALQSDHPDSLDATTEEIHARALKPSWVCLFEHTDGITDPYSDITQHCGPVDPHTWCDHHLRYQFGSHRQSPSGGYLDTVVSISPPDRVELEAQLLFQYFDTEKFIGF
jgi:hypothetical protein